MLKNLSKVLLLSMTVSLFSATSFAAGLGANTISSAKLPPTVSLQKSTQKAVFLNDGQKDIKQSLLDLGAMSVDMYQIRIKEANVINYGLIGDIYLGSRGLSNLGITAYPGKYGEVEALAGAINSNSVNRVMPYQVVEPMMGKNGLYTGTLAVNTLKSGVNYGQILHVSVFNDKYAGLTARVITLDPANDARLWPQLNQAFKVKK